MSDLRKAGLIVFGAVLMLVISCGTEERPAELAVTKHPYGMTPDGIQVDLYTLRNSAGVEAQIMTYGASLVSVRAPDNQGNFDDVVVGYNQLAPFFDENPYFGGIVGRFANRIDEGRFTLAGKEYQLATNNDQNHLHGGDEGFDKKVWHARPVKNDRSVGVSLSYLSPDGEENYPGNLATYVTYSLNEENELKLRYFAITDQKTIVNLTNHTYWNLSGGGTILDHEMMINASRYTPVDHTLIPTGELATVKGTPMDFTKPTPIGSRIDADFQQLEYGNGGYDHNWVLDKEGNELSLACRVHDPVTGRVMEILTTEPGLQFYSGNFLDGTITGKHGEVYEKHEAIVLEAQHFPDSPNQPSFPPTDLEPDEHYSQTTIYRFSVSE